MSFCVSASSLVLLTRFYRFLSTLSDVKMRFDQCSVSGEIFLWGRRPPYIFAQLLRADPLSKIKENQVFDHKFARWARIELRFWEVANLEKLNNFCLGHF